MTYRENFKPDKAFASDSDYESDEHDNLSDDFDSSEEEI